MFTHSSIRTKNEKLIRMRFFRCLLTVTNGLGNAEKANFREIGVIKRHGKLQFFLFSFIFSKNLEYNLEEVDLGSGTLFSLLNVVGFWHKLWPV